MRSIKNFEDLGSWKEARELAGCVYGLTRKPEFPRDFGLRDQTQRAAGSVMHNIAEGFESGSDGEFARFLKIARPSAGEVRSALYLALDAGYVTQQERRTAYELAVTVKRLINGPMTCLRNSKSRVS